MSAIHTSILATQESISVSEDTRTKLPPLSLRVNLVFDLSENLHEGSQEDDKSDRCHFHDGGHYVPDVLLIFLLRKCVCNIRSMAMRRYRK